MSADSRTSAEEAIQARRVVTQMAREVYDERGPDELFTGLIEAKRMLGIAISTRWPDRIDEVLEEQG